MCGIAGVVEWPGGNRSEAVGIVTAMVEAVAHRGPDEQRVFPCGSAVLGAARLSIRGLEDGAQPMVHAHSGVVVVCNGEIDNHGELKAFLATQGRLVTARNDVAVIADLYELLGEEAISKLKGAFALAIWYPAKQQLLLARDRAGERPLFYQADEQGVRFASEVAALCISANHAAPEIDAQCMQDYLRRGYFGAPCSPFQKLRKVAPGEVVVLDPQTVRARRYWRWNVPPVAKQPADLRRFDAIFREAVRRQSEVDVPYAVFLSGGIDSSLVAVVARSLRPEYPLIGYTVRFHEPSFDEGRFAMQVSALLKIPCEAVWVQPADFPRELTDLIAHTGEPLADPAWIPTAVLARRAAQDARIALVGEGGDELFGGYPTYLGARLSQLFIGMPKPVKATIRFAVRRLPPSEKKVTLSFLLKKFVDGAELEGRARHLLWTASIPPPLLKRLGVEELNQAEEQSLPDEPLLDMLQRYDLENSLAEGLLTKADRAGMRSAIELRAPFLDVDVMEFAARLPADERVKGITTKVFLKRYALQYLPKAIVYRKKRGLSVPLTAWLRGPLYDWAQGQLQNPLLENVGIRRPQAFALLEEHRQSKDDYARPLWNLLVLSEWMKWADSRKPGGDPD
ncbi:MAG TPA: asparagine synthase (glutamine-hydrolyzing) [Terriglobales bacterium]|nr:asparagine synthase (glutamine-hydrolyzing) [Terriglobales bacterium]